MLCSFTVLARESDSGITPTAAIRVIFATARIYDILEESYMREGQPGNTQRHITSRYHTSHFDHVTSTFHSAYLVVNIDEIEIRRLRDITDGANREDIYINVCRHAAACCSAANITHARTLAFARDERRYATPSWRGAPLSAFSLPP